MLNMRCLHKSKRVSWASDLDLCQVRLFLSEECPSEVGLNAQDHLQAKTSLLFHPGGAGSDDILPPGFEGTQSSSQMQIKLSQIPVMKWTNPLEIVLNLTWQVVAGEESKELEDQNQREMKVLEAIYPRPSSIPPNPSVSMDVEDSLCNDDHTALIPITPIEDEDSTVDAPSGVPPSSQPLLFVAGVPKGLTDVVESNDVAAEASVTLNHIMKNNEHGNSIDHELLNKILSNPEVIEKLVRDYGNTDNSQHTPNAGSSLVSSRPPIPLNQAETGAPSFGAFSASPSYPAQIGGGVGPVPPQRVPPPVVSLGAPPAKDVNYYKNLIQQHGGERRETPYLNNLRQPIGNQETTHNSRSREPKPKIMKPCIYFNSSKGCRNGANCAYQHDAAFQPRGSAVPGVQSSKRAKMDSEITNWLDS
ncbi:zinc finger CCCH domain-containing protein 6 isoform X2 [Prosopis cineraria]|uniref:zinc finger CCCH domain-containing protein 6 isoform X2 n=1 Tax=Prosopis cineraria TaxID=364024 RepID=UPI00240FC72B|nr:zinc finger CCCH domain-containing protein 6 isoform X2 [Prosopis cineraria]